MKDPIASVDAYIHAFPTDIQDILLSLHQLILKQDAAIVPYISYAMPAYKLNGKVLVYFAAFKQHIGFYATPTVHQQFKQALAPYKHGKGSVQFPLQQAMPYLLMEEMVKFRIKELRNQST